MSEHHVLARLAVRDRNNNGLELLLAERYLRSAYVQFETSLYDPIADKHSSIRIFIADRSIRKQFLQVASENFVKRYLDLVVHGAFLGDGHKALDWIRTQLGKEALPRGNA